MIALAPAPDPAAAFESELLEARREALAILRASLLPPDPADPAAPPPPTRDARLAAATILRIRPITTTPTPAPTPAPTPTPRPNHHVAASTKAAPTSSPSHDPSPPTTTSTSTTTTTATTPHSPRPLISTHPRPAAALMSRAGAHHNPHPSNTHTPAHQRAAPP